MTATIMKEQISTILAGHKAWLDDSTKGQMADLRGANLRGADLGETDMRGANLSKASLSGANLSKASLYGADMRGANLSKASLYGADMREASLRGASLYGADMREASLRGADLSGASLYGADLSGADLSGADLSKVKHVAALGQPNGWWAYAYLWGDQIWVRVGCRTKSLTDARVYWTNKEDRREIMAALDYAETTARLRGWVTSVDGKREEIRK